ncbi:hypothetical protein B566_EDAN015336 [Ephemera danica]|nr:hypothetical protein B566_EDAN015336 [Ephemera danica]
MNLVTLDSTTGTQYFFSTANASWFDASYFCNSYDMDLVTIETQEENDLILAHIESLGLKQAEHYWTSAHKIGRATWLWINGEIMIYDDWATGQPDNLETYRCMFLSGGDWYNYECEQSIMKAFICESRVPPENITEEAKYYRHNTSLTWTSGHKIGRTTYLWINGTYIEFADWAPGQPADPRTQSCLHLYQDDWRDYICYSYQYFICEERIP